MKPDQLLIALIVFSVVVVTGVLMMGDINDNYNLNLSTSEYTNTFNTIDEIYNTSRQAQAHTLGGEVDETDSWESMTKGAFSAMRLLIVAPELIGNIITDVAEEIGIPSFMITAALGTVAILIIFMIIYVVMRFKP